MTFLKNLFLLFVFFLVLIKGAEGMKNEVKDSEERFRLTKKLERLKAIKSEKMKEAVQIRSRYSSTEGFKSDGKGGWFIMKEMPSPGPGWAQPILGDHDDLNSINKELVQYAEKIHNVQKKLEKKE